MKKIILLLFGIAVFTSCTKQSDPVTNYIYTHSDSALVGDMVGFVDLYDSTYTSYIYGIVSGHEGAVVSLDGTPFHTTTDSLGKWTLKNIPAGTYNISITKDGYALIKEVAYKFIGNGTDYLGRFTLLKIPLLHPEIVIRPFHDYYSYGWHDTLYVTSYGDTIKYSRDSTFHPLAAATFTGKIDENISYGNIGSRQMSFYLGKTDHIDPLDPNSFIYNSGPMESNAYSNKSLTSPDLYEINFFKDSLTALGFKSGDRIFIAAYVCTWPCKYAYYTDINTGKTIYTGFSPAHSGVQNFILP
jgi:hypothetical protein